MHALTDQLLELASLDYWRQAATNITMAGDPLDLCNEWATQILVLLSLTLQFVLLFLAGIRRREASPVLRFILWLAYQLADSTAIYTVGNLSLLSISTLQQGRQRHSKLEAFWAPFLLLHLGGPDTITAYALEDNQLWLRHLTTLVVQVLGLAYVIYKHIGGGETLLLVASILMFAVGFVKYAERTWALKRGNLGSIRSSTNKKDPRAKFHFYLEDDGHGGWFKSNSNSKMKIMEAAREEEFLLRRAHSLFHICKCGAADSSADLDVEAYGLDEKILKGLVANTKHWVTVLEMELSLMYDILYTKAAVIHTEFGYLVRAVSPLVTAASFLLFHLSGKDGERGADVLITYILLGGAVFMEMTSLLSALGSSWTLAFLSNTRWSWLRHAALCARRWERLRGAVVSLRSLAKVVTCQRAARRQSLPPLRIWPGTMGQYNMLHLCTRRPDLLGRLARLMGVTEWWERNHYSGKIAIPKMVNELVVEHIIEIFRNGNLNTLGVIRNSWGKRTLERENLDMKLQFTLGVELQEGIIIWHIGTDIFLARSARAKQGDGGVAERVEAVTAVSNYMMFLLVKRPDMLPGLAHNRLYQQTCRNLEQIWSEPDAGSGSTSPDPGRKNLKRLFQLQLHDGPNNGSRLKERRKLASKLFHREISVGPEFPRLSYVIHVAEELHKAEMKNDGKTDPFQMLLELWTDILVYAANRGNRESHAKKLNNGGELTTFLWLMTEHFHHVDLYLKLRDHELKGEP